MLQYMLTSNHKMAEFYTESSTGMRISLYKNMYTLFHVLKEIHHSKAGFNIFNFQ